MQTKLVILRSFPLIIYVLLCYFFNLYKQDIENIYLYIIYYILGHPFGIKQTFVIKNTLGCLYLALLQNSTNLETTISISCYITLTVYKITFTILRELIELLSNKTYNPLMKRYDAIFMENDQIVFSVLFLCVTFILYANLILFYVYFVVLYLFLRLLAILRITALCLFTDSEHLSANELVEMELLFSSNFIRNIITGNILKIDY